MEYEDLTEKIIGCAFRVRRKIGFGFLESVYRKCMVIELEQEGMQAEPERAITVRYEDQVVGEFFADILVDRLVIVELKSVRALVAAHEIQLVNYLTATGMPVGLLLNFGESKVDVIRKVRTLAKTNPRDESPE